MRYAPLICASFTLEREKEKERDHAFSASRRNFLCFATLISEKWATYNQQSKASGKSLYVEMVSTDTIGMRSGMQCNMESCRFLRRISGWLG